MQLLLQYQWRAPFSAYCLPVPASPWRKCGSQKLANRRRRIARELLPGCTVTDHRSATAIAKVTAQDTNKALAIRRIAAHCLITIERPSASIGGVNASCALAQPRSGALDMPARRSPVQSLTFEYRLAQEAINLRLQANGMPAGVRRTELLRKASQIDVAGEINNWLSSPGLQPPT